MYWDPMEVQQCTLLSIKTGGCTEDCKYCSQSVRYVTALMVMVMVMDSSEIQLAMRLPSQLDPQHTLPHST